MPRGVDPDSEPTAVLVSGGLDSAILLAETARRGGPVHPIFVRFGLVWEAEEQAGLERFLAALALPNLAPLQVFEQPVRNVYGPHWSTTGRDVPDADSPDAAVYLPGRNLLLFSQAAVWCHLQGIPTIALGVLAGNPFADGTPEFLNSYAAVVNQALGGRLRFVCPYRTLTKTEVLRRGAGFPLGETMSCIRPVGGVHCGRCNKCAERRKAFVAAGLADPTRYA